MYVEMLNFSSNSAKLNLLNFLPNSFDSKVSAVFFYMRKVMCFFYKYKIENVV